MTNYITHYQACREARDIHTKQNFIVFRHNMNNNQPFTHFDAKYNFPILVSSTGSHPSAPHAEQGASRPHPVTGGTPPRSGETTQGASGAGSGRGGPTATTAPATATCRPTTATSTQCQFHCAAGECYCGGGVKLCSHIVDVDYMCGDSFRIRTYSERLIVPAL